MLVNRYVVFGAIVFFISVDEGQSISCFECNSYLDPDCALTPPPMKYSGKCPDDSFTLCRMIKQVIDFQVYGLQPNTRVIRMCGKQKEDANKCYQRSGFGGRQVVCACQDKDDCNSSSTIYVSTALLVGALLLVKISM